MLSLGGRLLVTGVHMSVPGLKQIADFVNASKEQPLRSTGATVTEVGEDLYNVIGSTPDPKRIPNHDNEPWKALFINLTEIINAQCYVTNDEPSGPSTHPQFLVGGHMTPDEDGIVVEGGTCYLMPLCKLHNAHDGKAFTHTEKKMLKLTGYMLGELAVTFAMRLPNENPYALLYYSEVDQTWKVEDYPDEHQDKWKSGLVEEEQPSMYVAVRRIGYPQTTAHMIESVRLPSLT